MKKLCASFFAVILLMAACATTDIREQQIFAEGMVEAAAVTYQEDIRGEFVERGSPEDDTIVAAFLVANYALIQSNAALKAGDNENALVWLRAALDTVRFINEEMRRLQDE